MSQILDIKLVHETKSGSLIRSPARIEIADGRIFFLKSPFALKDEIKAMAGSRWHGFDSENPRKMWSVEDCFRNQFQFGYLMGEDVYEWFDRELIRHEYRKYRRDGEDADPRPFVPLNRSGPCLHSRPSRPGRARRLDAGLSATV